MQRLPTDHPLARLVTSTFGDSDEAVFEGVEAIDWRQRMTPGTPLAYAERVLVATSRRLLLFYRDEDARAEGPGIPAAEVSYQRMRNVTATAQGTTSWLRFEYLADEDGWVTLTFAITDPQRAEHLRSVLAMGAGDAA